VEPTNDQTIVMLKPDTFSETYASVATSLACDLFRCLYASLHHQAYDNQEELSHASYVLVAERAFQQITERALSEEAFRHPLKDTDACKARLSVSIQKYRNSSGQVSTSSVIRQALQAFGFTLLAERSLRLSAHDIECIYAETISELSALKADLLTYLENQEVSLLLLEGKQAPSALQRVKTYVRYFLRYRNGERHRLENLIHVPDESDLHYLFQLFSSAWFKLSPLYLTLRQPDTPLWAISHHSVCEKLSS
jgi:hypothetical protein